MSTSDQTGDVDPTLANAVADQRIAFTSCKLGTTTFLTMLTREDALKAAFGTADPDFLYGLIHQVANAASKGQRIPDENSIKFLLAFVKASSPCDEIDAALAAQMAAAHVAAMKFANRLAHAETLEEQDSAERAFNKLARTFAGLVEARQRYRAASDAKTVGEGVQIERDGVEAAAGLKRRCGCGHRLMREVVGDPQLVAREQHSSWPAIIHGTLALCSPAHAVEPKRAQASPAWLQRCVARSVAGCTAVRKGPVRRRATQTR
jgi:hypothetical protein